MQPTPPPTIHTTTLTTDPEWLAAQVEAKLKGQANLTTTDPNPYLLMTPSMVLIVNTLMPISTNISATELPLPTEILREYSRNIADVEIFKGFEHKVISNTHRSMMALVMNTASYYERKHYLVATWGFICDWPSMETLAKERWLKSTKVEMLRIKRSITADLDELPDLIEKIFRAGSDWQPRYKSLIDI